MLPLMQVNISLEIYRYIIIRKVRLKFLGNDKEINPIVRNLNVDNLFRYKH